jgi:hypothetical protein
MLVEFNKHDAVFNWHELPEPVCLDFNLRDEIFKELQQKFKTVDQKNLLEMNKYAFNRIKSKYASHNKSSTKTT